MLLIFSLGLTFGSIFLNIMSLALPYWYYGTEGSLTYHFGLYKACISSARSGSSVCASFSDGGSNLNTTKWLMVISLLAVLAALVCELLKQFKLKEKHYLLQIGAAFVGTAGGLMIVGAILFATDRSLKDVGAVVSVPVLKLHVGFAFAVLSAIAAMVTSVLLVLDFRQNMGMN